MSAGTPHPTVAESCAKIVAHLDFLATQIGEVVDDLSAIRSTLADIELAGQLRARVEADRVGRIDRALKAATLAWFGWTMADDNEEAEA